MRSTESSAAPAVPSLLRPPINKGGDDGTDTQHTSGNLDQTVHATRVQLLLTSLYCTRTTDEHDHDEVYYLYGGVNGQGAKVSGRGPSAYQGADADNATAWDMNDSGDKQFRQFNATLLDEPLAAGQTATFSFGVLESDGTDLGAVLKAAGEVATTIGKGNLYAMVGGLALTTVAQYVPKNADDSLGGFTFWLRNNDGTLSVDNFKLGPYTTFRHPFDKATGTVALQFVHDRGDYIANYQLLGI